MSITIDITGLLDLDITSNGIGFTANQCTPTEGSNATTTQIKNCTQVDCTTVDCTTINCTTVNCTTVNCTTIQCTIVACNKCDYDTYDSSDYDCSDCKD